MEHKRFCDVKLSGNIANTISRNVFYGTVPFPRILRSTEGNDLAHGTRRFGYFW